MADFNTGAAKLASALDKPNTPPPQVQAPPPPPPPQVKATATPKAPTTPAVDPSKQINIGNKLVTVSKYTSPSLASDFSKGGVDASKFVKFAYTDQGTFALYNPDMLTGKSNVGYFTDDKGDKKVITYSPTALLNSSEYFPVASGEYKGYVAVPYTGGSTISYRYESAKDLEGIDFPMLGRTVLRDGKPSFIGATEFKEYGQKVRDQEQINKGNYIVVNGKAEAIRAEYNLTNNADFLKGATSSDALGKIVKTASGEYVMYAKGALDGSANVGRIQEKHPVSGKMVDKVITFKPSMLIDNPDSAFGVAQGKYAGYVGVPRVSGQAVLYSSIKDSKYFDLYQPKELGKVYRDDSGKISFMGASEWSDKYFNEIRPELNRVRKLAVENKDFSFSDEAKFAEIYRNNPLGVKEFIANNSEKPLTGSQITLPNGQKATVSSIKLDPDNVTYRVTTDKGTFTGFREQFIDSGFSRSGVLQKGDGTDPLYSVTSDMLDQIDSGKTMKLANSVYTDIPQKYDIVLFTGDNADKLTPKVEYGVTGEEMAKRTFMTRKVNPTTGKSYYVGTENNDAGFNYTYLHGDRAGVVDKFTGDKVGNGYQNVDWFALKDTDGLTNANLSDLEKQMLNAGSGAIQANAVKEAEAEKQRQLRAFNAKLGDSAYNPALLKEAKYKQDISSVTPDQIFKRFSELDKTLTRQQFDSAYAANPDLVKEAYKQYTPQSIVGSMVPLANGQKAKVEAIIPMESGKGMTLFTDKGTLWAYDKELIAKGNQEVPNGTNRERYVVSDAILTAMEQNKVVELTSEFYKDMPDKNQKGSSMSGNYYLFNDPSTTSSMLLDRYDLSEGYATRWGIWDNMQIARGENGKLFYVASTQKPNNRGGSDTTVTYIHGQRADLTDPFLNTKVSSAVYGTGYDTWQKKGVFGGGFLGDVFNDVAKIIDNPLVQFGLAVFNPPAALAYSAGKAAGNVLFNDVKFGDALESVAIQVAASKLGSSIAEQIGNVSTNAVVNEAVKGSIQGSIEAALTGQDIKTGLVGGLLGGGLGTLGDQLFGDILRDLFPDKTLVEGTTADEPVDQISGGAGKDQPNLVGDLGLNTNQLISDKNISPIGINPDNFVVKPIDPLNPDFTNLGGNFNSNVGLKEPTVPKLGGDNGIGITVPLFDNNGTLQGYQGVGGSVTPDFKVPLGDPNSYINNPLITGNPLVNNGTITPVPDFNTTLTDLANGNIGTGFNPPTPTPPPTPAPNNNNTGEQVTKRLLGVLKNFLVGNLTNSLTSSITNNNQNQSNFNGQFNNIGFNYTGVNMASPDYLGLVGNILSQNTQINRLEDAANTAAGKFGAVANEVNKPFTPYNVTSGAGSTNVNGQNITQQLSASQQQLANLANQASGMFGEVNVPNATQVRDKALSGASGLLTKAQGFDPTQSAGVEFDALQQLYAPQRERERLAMENRLLAQGRLGASENPALRQMEESFRQQDLQGAIQSRNLAFERQKQLQDMAQGLFTTGSSAAQLPTQLQAARANIGNIAGMLSQQPFKTSNEQAQIANQLSATQSTQGTALANIIANLKEKGLTNELGLINQAAALRNARDVAAIQGAFGGGSASALNQGINSAITGAGTALGNLFNQGGQALGGLLNQGVNAVGNVVGGAVNTGLQSLVNSLGGLFSSPYINPANGGLSAEQLNNMTDDEFLDFLLNTSGD